MAEPIRDAASLILWRMGVHGPEVLMGRRGAGAAFMPSKHVFPGGAVDSTDHAVPLAAPVAGRCRSRLLQGAGPGLAAALVVAALRETCEETGLVIGEPGAWPGDVPAAWSGFAARGARASGAGLRYVYRAITPEGRTRRFDARFFLAPATAVIGDAADFSAASGELSDLGYVPLGRSAEFDLPGITRLVLAEVAGFLTSGLRVPISVGFFDGREDPARVMRLD